MASVGQCPRRGEFPNKGMEAWSSHLFFSKNNFSRYQHETKLKKRGGGAFGEDRFHLQHVFN